MNSNEQHQIEFSDPEGLWLLFVLGTVCQSSYLLLIFNPPPHLLLMCGNSNVYCNKTIGWILAKFNVLIVSDPEWIFGKSRSHWKIFKIFIFFYIFLCLKRNIQIIVNKSRVFLVFHRIILHLNNFIWEPIKDDQSPVQDSRILYCHSTLVWWTKLWCIGW